ncbi:protein RGF1 INDUCIBLE TRANSCRIPTION FACTOR 1-like [Aristolochia californica]|uniref:protein RGF1 INDUCIBLE TRANSCRIPTION FACTOR 1-like n=1 Tax=Aristolochia californica TaxID=171875 RepID=UPI0035DB71CA
MVKEFVMPEGRPAWLRGLMTETFFVPCGTHDSARKNEKNIFCLCCCRSICSNCLPSHRSHPLLQVRRYVYHDVARLDDLEKLIDCSYVQPYTINNAKVVFLNQRPQTRPCKGSGNTCQSCERMLQEPYHYCSLSCKVEGVVDHGGNLSSILYRTDDEPEFAFSQFEGLRMDGTDVEEDEETTPSSVLEGSLQYMRDSSCSSTSSNTRVGGNLGVSEDSEVVKKKNNNGLLPKIMMSLSRRKGAPHRSPLC